jgi:hypothetical protein
MKTQETELATAETYPQKVLREEYEAKIKELTEQRDGAFEHLHKLKEKFKNSLTRDVTAYDLLVVGSVIAGAILEASGKFTTKCSFSDGPFSEMRNRLMSDEDCQEWEAINGLPEFFSEEIKKMQTSGSIEAETVAAGI